jgi:transcriptional regulator with XRE-family HTH domain
MLDLPDILLAQGMITYKKELLELLNLERQHWNNIKNGDRNFSKAHIYIVCKKYKINANWLMGFEKSVFRK